MFVDDINHCSTDSIDVGITVAEEGKVDKKKKKKRKNNDPSRSEKLRTAKLDDIEFAGSSSNIDSYTDANRFGTVGLANEGILENERVDSVTNERETQENWPPDCYSFIALHAPAKAPSFFLFGIFVWGMQITFLILLVLRVASHQLSTNDVDNPVSDF